MSETGQSCQTARKMFPQLLLSLTLLAEPTTATVLVRRTAVSSAEAGALMSKVAAQLAVPGLMLYPESQRRLSAFALKDGTTCGGKASCHAELGRQLGVTFLVLVSVSQIARDQSLALELFDVATEEVVEQESLLLRKRGDVPAAMLDSFAARITEHTRPPPAPPPEDTPKVTVLVPPPPPVEPAPVLPPAPPPERSHAGAVVLGVGAAAAVGAGVALLISGLNTRAALSAGQLGDDGRVRSELMGAQAQQQNDAANLQLGLAGGAGALALGLGAGAILAW